MHERPQTTLVTQNVDGLHERAASEAAGPDQGFPQPIALHGSIFRVRCPDCGVTEEHRDPIDATSLDALPHCQRCSALLRPDVVWFGEGLPELEMARATKAAGQAEAALVVGTQGAVQPAAGLVTLAHRSGARIVVVDPGETAFDGIAEVKLAGKAGDLLPQILAA
jgi:NAD-dependent deacetylase